MLNCLDTRQQRRNDRRTWSGCTIAFYAHYTS